MPLSTGVTLEHEPERFDAKEALIVYRKTSGTFNHDVVIVKHDLQPGEDGTLTAGPGQALDRASLGLVLERLREPKETKKGVTVLEPTWLAQGPDLAAWWQPAVRRDLFFDDATANGTYPLPALVFVLRKRQLQVFALPESKRPTPSTKLFHAPLLNVYASGVACLGSAKTPRGTRLEDGHLWANALLNAQGNHVKHRATRTPLRDLMGQIKNTKHFPKDELLTAGCTLKAVLRAG